MTGSTLRLSAGEAARAIGAVDLLDLVTEELIGRVVGSAVPPVVDPVAGTAEDPQTGHLSAVAGSAAIEDGGLTRHADPATGEVCVLPTASLWRGRAAGLVGLAARELHSAGVVTAAVFGSEPATHLVLSVIGVHLPTLSHVAVTAGAGYLPTIERSVRDQFELAGISLSTTADTRRAAFGATLLIVADHPRDRLELGQLPAGVLIVNASGRDLPDSLVESVDQIYVDDLELLEDNRGRNFVRMHLAAAASGPNPPIQHREGWHRHQAGWRHRRHIEADLGRVLTGAHPGRTHLDDILLVELLSAKKVDATFTSRLHQAAVKHGLGCWTDSVETE